MNVKKLIKKILRYKTINKKEYVYDESKHPKVLNDFYANNKKILDKNSSLEFSTEEFAFTSDAEKINKAFKLMYTVTPNNNINQLDLFDGLDNGIPIKYKPFPLCITSIKKELFKKNLFWYPAPGGNTSYRKKITEYLKKEDFKNIDEENVVLTMSTTHAFNLQFTY